MTTLQVFVLLLAAAIILIGAEVFVPGGILGVLGVAAFVASMMAALFAFDAPYSFYVVLAEILVLGIALVLWIRFFPRSGFGRRITLEQDGRSFKGSQEGIQGLLGKTGTTKTDLRPSGFAMIDGRRVDVVTEGGMIEAGVQVQVVEVEGNRVVVRPVES